LDCFHKGYYKVFDLCEEGCYVSTKFHDKVSRFPISKERPPTLDLIKKFCVSVDNWLISHDNNVVVIFEKKKGRTSVLLASYLVYSALVQDAITALEYYAFQRTGNIKVKASPSKQRYVAYFERMRKLEKMGLKLQSNELRVDKIAIQGLHSAKKLCKLKITDGNRNYEVLHIEVIEKAGAVIRFNKKCVISGDTLFQFYFENKVEPQFWLWINTSFYGNAELFFSRKTIDCESSKFRKKNLATKFRLNIDIQVENEGNKTWNEENKRIASKSADYILSESFPDTPSSLTASSDIDIDNLEFEEDLPKELLIKATDFKESEKKVSTIEDKAISVGSAQVEEVNEVKPDADLATAQDQQEPQPGARHTRARSSSGRKLIVRDSPSVRSMEEFELHGAQSGLPKEVAPETNQNMANVSTNNKERPNGVGTVEDHDEDLTETKIRHSVKTVLSVGSCGSPSSRKIDTIRKQRRKLGEKVTKRDTIGASRIPELKKMMTLGLDNSEEALLRACKYLSSENRSDVSDDALLSLYRISTEIADVVDAVRKTDFDVFVEQGGVLTTKEDFATRSDLSIVPSVEDVIEAINDARKWLIGLKNEIAIATNLVRLITFGRLVRYIKVVLESTDIKEITIPSPEEAREHLAAEDKLKRLVELMKITRNSIVETLDNMISQVETSASIEDAVRIASDFQALKKKVQHKVDEA
jgi:hypothetical protein